MTTAAFDAVKLVVRYGGEAACVWLTRESATKASATEGGQLLTVNSNSTFGSNSLSRQRVTGWSIDGGATSQAGTSATISTTPILMNVTHAVTFYAVTQYRVSVAMMDASGEHTVSPQSEVLLVGGAPVNTLRGTAWVDLGSTAAIKSITWARIDVTPSQTPQSTATAPLTLTVDAKVYRASVQVKDFLGFGVGSAEVSARMANGTTIEGLTADNGTMKIGAVPLGP